MDPNVLYVIAHDNLHHLRNFVSWARSVVRHIVIVDNASTYPPLLDWYLTARDARECHIVRLSENLGPRFYLDEDMRRRMPKRYLLSDPDLEPFVSEDLSSIVDRLSVVSVRYGAWKVGSALHLWPESDMLSGEYHLGRTIAGWEMQFWMDPEPSDPSVMYADVDTTFCLVDWSNPMLLPDHRRAVHPRGWMNNYRLGGTCTMLHLPWKKDHWREYPMHELQWYTRTDGRALSTTVKMLFDNGMIVRNRPTDTVARRAFWLTDHKDNDSWWTEIWPDWEPSWWQNVRETKPCRVCIAFPHPTVQLVTATLLIVCMNLSSDVKIEWSMKRLPDYDFLDALYRSEYWIGCALGQRCLFRSDPVQPFILS